MPLDSFRRRYEEKLLDTDPLPVEIQYESTAHHNQPHVVKVSGGRTSGMMLVRLLQEGYLDKQRGDVAVFNNTSAEHPNTYSFILRVKEWVEREFSFPLFIVEFKTYEVPWNGRHVRRPLFRLAKPVPFDTDPLGYHWKGEVYEELLSHKRRLPSRTERTCTKHLKVESTFAFLKEWFRGDTRLATRGHGMESSQVAPSSSTTQEEQEVMRYCLESRHTRETGEWQDYTAADLGDTFREPGGTRPPFRMSGKHAFRFISLVGFRADEPRRVARMRGKNLDPKGMATGEFQYAPLASMGIDSKEVKRWWGLQHFDLEEPQGVRMSNCTYCFMKGNGELRALAKVNSPESLPQEWRGTPVDLGWWERMERKYTRKKLGPDGKEVSFGFWGVSSNKTPTAASFRGEAWKDCDIKEMPCECTD